MSTFAEIVRARATDEHVGLRFGDQQWTWKEVVQEAADRAASLPAASSTERSLHLGILLENTPDFIFWTCAAALSGAAIVGINPTRRGADLARDIRHADCDLIITEDRQKDLLDGIDHGIAAGRVINIDSDGYQDYLAPHRGAALPTVTPDAAAIMLLLFSSGSTGAPKAVICSQGRLGALADALTVRTEMTRGSISYLCMPLFHGNSMMMNFAPALAVGATVCLARKFSASGFARDIHRYGATFVNYVGRALAYALAVPETANDRSSTLQLAMGTEASVSDIASFSARFNCRVSEGYGMSEGVLRINRTPDAPADSLGLAVAGTDVRVMDETTGRECPRAVIDTDGRILNSDRAIGQLVAIGKAEAFEGYYKNPGAMADRIKGANFWTGDLAYRDEGGFFYFAGRSSDWLRVDSENFSAGPVERILENHPDVAVALVHAVPDPRTGDQVMCTIQLQPGATFDPDGFRIFLDGRADLGTKWRPRFIRLVDQVPTTGSNKVAKTQLRREGWVTNDPIWWRTGADLTYRLLDEADRMQLNDEFAEHGRTMLLAAV